MDWQNIQNDYAGSFGRDIEVPDWNGHGVKIHRVQEWDNGIFLPPSMDVRDIYLGFPWIAAGWRKIYGTPTLADFVPPLTRSEIMALAPVSVKGVKPWRVYHGKDECQWMNPYVLQIFDVSMRLARGVHPRGVNDRFVLGDCGCWPGKSCPDHAGAHDNQVTADMNYSVFEGFNLTHYRQQKNIPAEYKGPWVNIWRDPFPMRNLKKELYDAERDYALYEILSRIFVGNSRDFKTSTGLLNYFESLYEDAGGVLHGDDFEAWCHFWHIHLYMSLSEINSDAKMITLLP